MATRDKEKSREYHKQWYLDNKEHLIECAAKWYQKNKENRKKQQMEYRLNNKELYNKATRKYSKTEKGRVADRRKQDKRKRDLGFFPLNKYFKGSEAHHISENLIVYLPSKIHKSIQHSIWTWRGMDIINKLSLEFLRGDKICL